MPWAAPQAWSGKPAARALLLFRCARAGPSTPTGWTVAIRGNLARVLAVLSDVRPRWHRLSELVASVAFIWGGHGARDRGLGAGAQVIVPADRAWAYVQVVAMQSPSQPVGLPGTAYAYDLRRSRCRLSQLWAT